MTDVGDNDRLLEQRLVFNRKLVVFVHVMVGFLSALWYLSQIDLGHFAYWQSRAGMSVVLIGAPAIVPYVVSGVYAFRVVTHRRLRLLLFLLLLVAGAVVMGLLFSGGFGIKLSGFDVLTTAATQAGAYVWAAELLLHVI
ncbi:MAG TPA: hypothetical protein VFA81_12710 [Burkholderiales bacterium]|nr:hypothetical protein [Burkholderiales bacterium]